MPSTAVAVKRLKNRLPLVNIIKELLELAHVNRAGRVFVEQIWNDKNPAFNISGPGLLPCDSSLNSM